MPPPVEINRIPKFNVTSVKTGAYNAVVSDLIPVDATVATRIITLPTDPQDQAMIAIKMIAVGGAFVTTINTGGTNVFNKAGGSATLSMSLLNQAMILQFQASTGIWYVIADDLSLAQLDLRFANLNSPTFTGTPTVPTPTQGDNSQKIASTNYVDLAVLNAIAAANPQTAADYATTTKLPNSPIYANGVAGIGATITTLTVNVPLTVDSSTPGLLEIVLVKNEADAGGLGGAKNGRYYVSQLATAILPWILTRCLDYDQPSDINETGPIFISNGTAQSAGGNKSTSWGLTTKVTTVGTDVLTYTRATNDPSIVALTTGFSLTGAMNEAKGADIASAATTNIGAGTGNYFDVTGTTTITAFDSVQAGTRRIVHFTGSLILTYNAVSLILPGAANITTTAGDVATFMSLGSGNWICINYLSNDTGAWIPYVPSYTGFSADPSAVTARYSLFGKTCSVYVRATAGTSNATTFTITLPIAAANTATQPFTAVITNNGTNAMGRMSTNLNSTTLDIFVSVTATAFTASGSKNCSFALTYETI